MYHSESPTRPLTGEHNKPRSDRVPLRPTGQVEALAHDYLYSSSMYGTLLMQPPQWASQLSRWKSSSKDTVHGSARGDTFTLIRVN